MAAIIREAVPDDAEEIIAYMQRLCDEPDTYLPLGPGEYDRSVEDERKVIEKHNTEANCLLLIVEDAGKIVGLINCTGGIRRANRHGVILGITLALDYRGQGLGTELMSRAIEWAKGTGIVTRIELLVYANNTKAIHLYEKLGFVTEGRLRRAVVRNGEYVDSLVMGLLL